MVNCLVRKEQKIGCPDIFWFAFNLLGTEFARIYLSTNIPDTKGNN
jgi:hypothetical protein